MQRGVLEVAVLHERDLEGCAAGGADRVSLAVPGEGALLSPDVPTAAAVIRGSDVPVRVLLRLDDTVSVTGGGFSRLVGLGQEYLALGAEGLELGFLDRDLEVDVEVCAALLEHLPGARWTCHRVVDQVLEPVRAWRALLGLPGLTAVRTAGSPQGIDVGLDDLLALTRTLPTAAPLVLAAGGLSAEHVPWLVAAGVRQLHVDLQVRPGGTHRSYVDAGYVRSWRAVLDGETDRADRTA